jgi:hypothetical protein
MKIYRVPITHRYSRRAVRAEANRVGAGIAEGSYWGDRKFQAIEIAGDWDNYVKQEQEWVFKHLWAYARNRRKDRFGNYVKLRIDNRNIRVYNSVKEENDARNN